MSIYALREINHLASPVPVYEREPVAGVERVAVGEELLGVVLLRDGEGDPGLADDLGGRVPPVAGRNYAAVRGGVGGEEVQEDLEEKKINFSWEIVCLRNLFYQEIGGPVQWKVEEEEL